MKWFSEGRPALLLLCLSRLPHSKLSRSALHSEKLMVLMHYGKLRVFSSLHDVFLIVRNIFDDSTVPQSWLVK